MPLWIKVSIPITALLLSSGVTLFFASPEQRPAAFIGLCLLAAILIFLTYKLLEPLEKMVQQLERVTEGKLHDYKRQYNSSDELGRLDLIFERSTARMQVYAERAESLSRGGLQDLDVDDYLDAKRLSDVDLPRLVNPSPLELSFHELTNQLRRLSLQARVIAEDRLESPLLSEQISGELGEGFALMVSNLRDLATRAQDIADGNLTMDSDKDGDLNQAFNAMVTSLKSIVEEIIQNTMHISTSAEEILMVLREQELAASHQASSVEETQRTMVTLLSSAKKIAESAQTVFKSAERTQANNRLISDRAAELKSHTERIGEILETIKEIADRSDLLALNASLEGLRAGEAGKGFTLVAGEMRRLAENVKGSVGNIKELLSDIRESALSSVMAIEEGTRLSERTTDSALKITLITQQQQSGTEQVTQSMEELSHLINQGLAGTRQVTIAATELTGLSEDMRNLVASFDVGKQLEPAPIEATTLPSVRAPFSFSSEFSPPASTGRTPGRQTHPTPVRHATDLAHSARALELADEISKPPEADTLETPKSAPESPENARPTMLMTDYTPTVDISAVAEELSAFEDEDPS